MQGKATPQHDVLYKQVPFSPSKANNLLFIFECLTFIHGKHELYICLITSCGQWNREAVVLTFYSNAQCSANVTWNTFQHISTTAILKL